MSLKRLIASKALELMQLLEHCEDPEFIDRVAMAVTYCDYATLDTLEDETDEENA